MTVGFTIATVGQAAAGWRVFATASDNGSSGFAIASADADVSSPNALALRSRTTAKVNWSIFCLGSNTVRAGQVFRLDVKATTKCSVSGSVNSTSGAVRIDLLKR